jgi:hypothetical protein
MDSKKAYQELQNFQKGRQSAGAYYDKYQKELGVGDVKARADDLRGVIRGTQDALQGVGEAVAGRTRGQLVTEAQRSRLANLERQPIADELGQYQGDYSEEMQKYRDLLGESGTRSQLAYQSDADRLASLQNNYQTLYDREKAAEEKRRWEAQQAESRRQFNAQMAKMDREIAANQAAMASLMRSSGGSASSIAMSSKKQAEIQKALDNARKAAYGGPSLKEKALIAASKPGYQKVAQGTRNGLIKSVLGMNPVTSAIGNIGWGVNKIRGLF